MRTLTRQLLRRSAGLVVREFYGTSHFQNIPGGGSGGTGGDGAANNDDNYDTPPASDGSDDIVIDSVPLSGGANCKNLIAGTVTTIDASWNTSSFLQIRVYAGTVQNFTWNASPGGGAIQPGTGFSVLTFSACTFNADTGFALNCLAGCQFQSNSTQNITDDGSGVWGGFVFSGPIVATGAGLAVSAASTFSTTVSATAITGSGAGTFEGAVTCNQINAIACAFNGGVTQNGAGVTLNVASLGAPVNWPAVTTVASINCVAAAALSGVGAAYVLTGGGGTVSVTLSIPSPNGVLVGYGGNYQEPPNNKVQDGYAFGVSGGSVGTLPAGSGGSRSREYKGN